MRDIIIFPDESLDMALSFYVEALSEGIAVKWGGWRFSDGFRYYVVEVDVEKTIELKNKKEG